MADEQPIPELYADSFRFTVGVYGLAITVGVNPPHPEPSKPEPAKDLAVVRISLETAKVLAMLLRRDLKQYERQALGGQKIQLPPGVYTQLGIAQGDWGDV